MTAVPGLQGLGLRDGGVLNDGEKAVLNACAEVLIPSGGAIAMSGIGAGAVAYFDQLMTVLPVTTRVLLRALIRSVEYSPWVFGPFKSRLTHLGVADRQKVIRALSDSRIYLLRTSFVALRTVLTIAYFGNDEVKRSIGLVEDMNPFDLREA
jgi:hypothetical protein